MMKEYQEKQYEKHATDLAIIKSDPENQHFTSEEEREAKSKTGTEERGKGGGDKEWREFLQELLVAITRVTDAKRAGHRTELMANQWIDNIQRDSLSVAEVGTEIEKALKFAVWQTAIFKTVYNRAG